MKGYNSYKDIKEPDSGVLRAIERHIDSHLDRIPEDKTEYSITAPPYPGFWTKKGYLVFLDLHPMGYGTGHRLTSLPEDFEKLKHLRYLSLSSQKLASLPASFGKLIQLKKLSLSSNLFQEFPEPILKLKNLERLSLDNNQMQELPEDFGDCFPKLTRLLLRKNQITRLPDSFTNLTKLIRLDLTDNPLKELPEDIGDLVNLIGINLTRTDIRTLPESLTKIPHLKLLHVQHVKLESFPKGFEDLGLTDLVIDESSLQDEKAQKLMARGQTAVRVPDKHETKWVQHGVFSGISEIIDPPGGVLDFRKTKKEKK